MQDIMQQLKPLGEKYASGDFRGGLHFLHKVWSQLPEPKPATPNAYLIIEYAVKLALKLRDFNEAWVWANRAPDFKEKRQDMGEVELLIGKVAYEDGKLDMAMEQLKEAKRKSRGRVFAGEDPKYVALLRTK